MVGVDEDILELLARLADVVNLAVFGALALVGIARWTRARDTATGWFAAMFTLLSVVLVASALTSGDAPILVAALSVFPFLLLRFTAAFASPPPWMQALSMSATAIIAGWALLAPLPSGEDELSGGALAFVVAFLAHWTILSVAAAWYFVRESRRSRGVAARRMRLFAVAALLLALLLMVTGLTGGAEQSPVLDITVQLAATASALLFLAAFAPPAPVRRAWLAGELDDLQARLRALVLAQSAESVHEEALALVQSTTGCGSVLMLDIPCTAPVAVAGMSEVEVEEALARSREHHVGRHRPERVQSIGRFVVVSGRTLPWFGTVERELVDTISRFATVAEQQAAVLERERAANEQLRQVDQLKSEFVAMVAHDIRSPMSVITGFADTIHDRWDEIDDASKLEYLRVISRNTRNLADFVEDVLQVARMESGGLQFSREPFDPREVVDRIVSEARVTHPHLVLDVRAPGEVPAVVGDAARNRQILANLVDNARKFSGDDPHVRIELTFDDDAEEVAIAVRDNGVGIEPDDVPLLFRRFSRVGATRRTVAGTGLGLYIVKTMVEAQGGRIWVESIPGEGSTFTYTLPVAGGGAAA